MVEDFGEYLNPTRIIDSDHKTVREYALTVIDGTKNQIDQAVKLYLAVRDTIRYDPYAPFYLPLHYKASYVLKRRSSFCVPKASLLCALGRACGIPSRVGFATVRNHLATRQLLDYLGTDVFVYHAFVEFHLERKWVKATPAFNRELCERHGVPPLEFSGREDSLFQAYNSQNMRYIEYLDYTDAYVDIPLADILAAWERTYGKKRIQKWISAFEAREDASLQNFDEEDVLRS